MVKVAIYHNPKCATSRKALALIKEAGIEPEVIEYLKTPLNHEALTLLIKQMAIPTRKLLRTKGGLYKELGLDDLTLTDEVLLDAIVKHPVLMERPIVVTAKGARLCRPCELVQDIL